MNIALEKHIAALPINEQQHRNISALCTYLSEKDAWEFLRFLEETPDRAGKLCSIIAQQFKAIRDENTAAWDKALADELALLMQADK